MTGHIFVISGPSGVGKSTVIDKLCELGLTQKAVSHTTRPKREKEIEGKDYFFIDKITYDKMFQGGEFITFLNFNGNHYGLARKTLIEKLEQNINIALDIDPSFWARLHQEIPNSSSIFLLPPQVETLRARMQKRGEKPEVIANRLQLAAEILSYQNQYDFKITNEEGKVDLVILQISGIIHNRTNQPIHNNYHLLGSLYNKHQKQGTAYLAYSDIYSLLTQFLNPVPSHLSVLDYGCGTGISTRHIQGLGLNCALTVTGVDINESCLELAKRQDNQSQYLKIDEAKVNMPDGSYDFINCSLVLFELESRERIRRTLMEIKRLLKPDGIFIATTGSIEMYNTQYRWATINNDFSENSKQLKSGDLAKVKVKVSDTEEVTLRDYYWTEQDYQALFVEAGFHLLKVHKPLAQAGTLLDEQKVSPFIQFVASSQELALKLSMKHKK